MAGGIHGGNINEDFSKRIQFIVLADKMKSIYRRTLLADKSRRETDAEHSWHLALMAIVLSDYAPRGTDINRVIQMVLIHDLVEIFAGDTFCYDNEAVQGQHRREEEAAKKLFSILPYEMGEKIEALWKEFDLAETPDAKFAVSLDRFQPVINNFLSDLPTWRNGKAAKEQIMERTGIIKSALPPAWELIQEILDYAEENKIFDKTN